MAIGLSAILLPALLTGFLASREGKAQYGQRIQAVALLKTTVEAVRSVREKSWSLFAINGTFHPEISGSSWTLVAGEDTVNSFTRKVDISDVNRGTCPGVDCGKIVTTGGTTDPSTRKVVVAVSWGLPYISSISSTLYMTRYLGNNAFIQTTETDFNAGTKSGVDVTNTDGGEVVLGAGGKGDWCKPSQFIVASLDLPKQGVADAITAIEGKAFVGTGDNASGVSFANIAISNENPPVPSIAGTFDGYKTNGVFGEQNYAYIATDNNRKEVVIIDLTRKDANNKHSEAGYFDAPQEKNGVQVYVAGNIGYVIVEDKLYNFDLTSKTGSRPIIDSDGIRLDGKGTRVVVVGSYAYVTIKESSVEMQIVDVGNPSNLTVVGQADVGGKDAKDIFVNPTGTRAYMVTSKQDSQKEFFIVDLSTKTGNRPIVGSYETNDMNPKAVTIVPGNRAIVVGKGGEEYQVIDISNESLPVRCGGLDLGTRDAEKVNGIASVLETDGDAYSYIMTGDSNAEFKIIEGGAGGTQYKPSGTFESNTFETTSIASFNRFDSTVNRPTNTNIEFQIAIKQAVGSCTGVIFSSVDFVGPSGTSSDKFQTVATSGRQLFNFTVPLSINTGQCFRYKAYLSTTDFTASPVLYDVTVNYSS